VITAEGELQASEKLAQAAGMMTAQPAALQLRLLQTVVEVAAEKNSTVVLPFPVELLRFLERSTPPEPSTAESPEASSTPTTALTSDVITERISPGVVASEDVPAGAQPPSPEANGETRTAAGHG
jgi:hypothetical protein